MLSVRKARRFNTSRQVMQVYDKHYPKHLLPVFSDKNFRPFVRMFQENEGEGRQNVVKRNCFFFFFCPFNTFCLQCYKCFEIAAAVSSHGRGLASCLFGSAASNPVAQKPRHPPMSELLTLLFREQNNVCSYQSAAME